MSDDPVEDIADAKVTFLNNASEWSQPPSFVFMAEKTADPSEELYLETQELRVLVVPYGEAAEKIGRGGQAREIYQTNLIIVGKLTIVNTRTAYSLFARELKLAIRRQSKFGRYYWAGDETVTKYDPRLLNKNSTFATVTRFDFSGTN